MPLDRIVVSVKIGDCGKYLDGMVVDKICERHWGKPIEQIIPPFARCRKAFRFIEIDPRMEPLVDSLLAPDGFSKIINPFTGGFYPDPEKYRIRGGVLPLVDLAAFVGKSEAEIRDQTVSKEIINGYLMPETIFKSSLLLDPTGKMLDKASVSTGDFDIGAGSDDYATWVLFAADIAATLTGDLKGTQISAISQTAQCAINKALAGYALTLTSDTDHYGDFNEGWLTSLDYNYNGVYSFALTCSSASSGATINVSKLKIKYNSTVATQWSGKIGFYSATTNITNNANDIIIDSNSCPTIGIGVNHASCIVKLFNYVQANGARIINKRAHGLFLYALSASSIFENITIYHNTGGVQATYGAEGISNYGNVAATFNNIACFDNSCDYTYGTNPAVNLGLGNGVASKCASSDTSGSEAGLRSLVAADEFESLDIADSNFLKATPGGTLDANGTAPSIAANTYGIRGTPRPH